MVTVTEAAADHILAHLRAGDGSEWKLIMWWKV